MNAGLVRRACWLWWNDASAGQLSEGVFGLTRRMGEVGKLNAIPAALLEPGDLAVTADGSHVLAYLGEGRWIEADPYVNRVIRMEPGSFSPWREVKVIPCRWRCLENEKGTTGPAAVANGLPMGHTGA